MIACAFSKASKEDEKLFKVLSRVVWQSVGNVDLEHLGSTAWAFATVDEPDVELFIALARVAELRLHSIDS